MINVAYLITPKLGVSRGALENVVLIITILFLMVKNAADV